MNTQIASKLTSFALAVVLNGMMLAGIGYLFDTQAQVQVQVQPSVVASTNHGAQSIGEAS
jgi:hypothetical protein